MGTKKPDSAGVGLGMVLGGRAASRNQRITIVEPSRAKWRV